MGRYTKSPDAAATTVGDRVVVYHRISRTAVVLNPTAGLMWQHLAESRTAAELAQHLCGHYASLSPEDAERDVAAFLAELLQHALVSVRP